MPKILGASKTCTMIQFQQPKDLLYPKKILDVGKTTHVRRYQKDAKGIIRFISTELKAKKCTAREVSFPVRWSLYTMPYWNTKNLMLNIVSSIRPLRVWICTCRTRRQFINISRDEPQFVKLGEWRNCKKWKRFCRSNHQHIQKIKNKIK